MRGTLRLLAEVKNNANKYLTPFARTGLTGLFTHPCPRPTLMHIYKSTLQQLEQLPENTVYRTATEALTKHRLALVEATKPPGYEEWQQRIKAAIEKDEAYKASLGIDGTYVVPRTKDLKKPDDQEPEALEGVSGVEEGPAMTEKEAAEKEALFTQGESDKLTPQEIQDIKEHLKAIDPEYEGLSDEDVRQRYRSIKPEQLKPKEVVYLEQEPPLTAAQIQELESQIGGGLIEEVLQVAEGELLLVQKMKEARIWEELEEEPQEGQWTYFERKP